MKTEELKAQGLTEEQISFVMAENGKDLKKLQKENDNLTADRDDWKEKAETAETTLKGFEGVDLETMQRDLADWKKKAEDAEKNAQAQIYERDFNDTLKSELERVKFSSEAAKRAIMAEIKESGLKMKDGKILGLNDLISQMKEKDASAFIDEEQQKAQQNAARFTQPFQRQNQGVSMTKDQIMGIKDASERQDAIAANMHLFGKGE
nr:MAG TPA: minor structural protein [Caudoviricetes sp.]